VRATFEKLLTGGDEEVMGRVQENSDPRAFALLVRRWDGPIRRLCTRMIGDVHVAEDLTQEVFTRLFRHRRAYRNEARFSTYLWRIALNACRDELRSRGRRPVESLETEEQETLQTSVGEDAASPFETASAREEATVVKDAVMALDEEHRAVVVLRHYEGLKFREIAAVLGIAEGTAKTRMVSALTRLAQTLKPLARER
jgi:RNA polymerase sigma-70 factor (ECF subfamily)